MANARQTRSTLGARAVKERQNQNYGLTLCGDRHCALPTMKSRNARDLSSIQDEIVRCPAQDSISFHRRRI
jgi:hypothetical protein